MSKQACQQCSLTTLYHPMVRVLAEYTYTTDTVCQILTYINVLPTENLYLSILAMSNTCKMRPRFHRQSHVIISTHSHPKSSPATHMSTFSHQYLCMATNELMVSRMEELRAMRGLPYIHPVSLTMLPSKQSRLLANHRCSKHIQLPKLHSL